MQTDLLPSLYRVKDMGPLGQEGVRGDREGMRVETPKDPIGQAPMEGQGYGGFFRPS